MWSILRLALRKIFLLIFSKSLPGRQNRYPIRYMLFKFLQKYILLQWLLFTNTNFALERHHNHRSIIERFVDLIRCRKRANRAKLFAYTFFSHRVSPFQSFSKIYKNNKILHTELGYLVMPPQYLRFFQ